MPEVARYEIAVDFLADEQRRYKAVISIDDDVVAAGIDFDERAAIITAFEQLWGEES